MPQPLGKSNVSSYHAMKSMHTRLILLALATLSCATLPIFPEEPRDEEADREKVERFFRSGSDPGQSAALRSWLGLRLTGSLLTEDEVARAAGARMADGVGYGTRALWLAVGASLDRGGVDVTLSEARLVATGQATWRWVPGDEKPGPHALFGLATEQARPLLPTPWPQDHLRACRQTDLPGDRWAGIKALFQLAGHVSTAGIFLLPRLLQPTGVPLWEGPQGAESALRELQAARTWALDPRQRAAARLQRAQKDCTAQRGSPCNLYGLLLRTDGTAKPEALMLRLTYRLNALRVEEELRVLLPPWDRLAGRPQALAAQPQQNDETLSFSPSPPSLPAVLAGPPVHPRALSAKAEIHVFSPAEVQAVLHLPIRPEPDAMLYECRVGQKRCTLRVETTAETWVTTSAPRRVAAELLYPEHHRAHSGRLSGPRGEDTLDYLTYALESFPGRLLRQPDHASRSEETLIVVEEKDGGEDGLPRVWGQQRIPLPDGPNLPQRINAALGVQDVAEPPPVIWPSPASVACAEGDGEGCLKWAAAPVKMSERTALLERGCALHSGIACAELGDIRTRAGDQRRAVQALQRGCQMASGEACLALAERGQPTLRERACQLGAGTACFQLAEKAPDHQQLALMERACLMEDKESCFHIARTFKRVDQFRSEAYSRLCEMGEAKGCAELADLLSGVIDKERLIDRPRCLARQQWLQQRACGLGDKSSCRAGKTPSR